MKWVIITPSKIKNQRVFSCTSENHGFRRDECYIDLKLVFWVVLRKRWYVTQHQYSKGLAKRFLDSFFLGCTSSRLCFHPKSETRVSVDSLRNPLSLFLLQEEKVEMRKMFVIVFNGHNLLCFKRNFFTIFLPMLGTIVHFLSLSDLTFSLKLM